MKRKEFIKYFGEKPEDVLGKHWRKELKAFNKDEDTIETEKEVK